MVNNLSKEFVLNEMNSKVEKLEWDVPRLTTELKSTQVEKLFPLICGRTLHYTGTFNDSYEAGFRTEVKESNVKEIYSILNL